MVESKKPKKTNNNNKPKPKTLTNLPQSLVTLLEDHLWNARNHVRLAAVSKHTRAASSGRYRGWLEAGRRLLGLHDALHEFERKFFKNMASTSDTTLRSVIDLMLGIFEKSPVQQYVAVSTEHDVNMTLNPRSTTPHSLDVLLELQPRTYLRLGLDIKGLWERRPALTIFMRNLEWLGQGIKLQKWWRGSSYDAVLAGLRSTTFSRMLTAPYQTRVAYTYGNSAPSGNAIDRLALRDLQLFSGALHAAFPVLKGSPTIRGDPTWLELNKNKLQEMTPNLLKSIRSTGAYGSPGIMVLDIREFYPNHFNK